MRKFLKTHKPSSKQIIVPPPALDVLVDTTAPFAKTLDQRADMTISCKDSDYIPKVRGAGSLRKLGGIEVQVMHTGLLVKNGGYYGEWMSRIIRDLKGHHEPQEEKVFHEILKRIKTGGTMIELGSFWSYYSLWFNTTIKKATNICCEPDPNNIEVGKTNAKLNKADMTFIDAAAGEDDGSFIDFPLESEPGKTKRVPILSVDKIVRDRNIKQLDILHMDVQGQELAAIRGAIDTIKKGKLRFLMVSTHHFSISGDPMTHYACEELIKSLGGHIITSHTILESFSGDGLIAASFSPADEDLHINVSINSSGDSLYRPYEQELSKMIGAYEALRRSVQGEA